MQPLNAAKLFNASLLEILPAGEARRLAAQVEGDDLRRRADQ